jgi:hypothetical protein
MGVTGLVVVLSFRLLGSKARRNTKNTKVIHDDKVGLQRAVKPAPSNLRLWPWKKTKVETSPSENLISKKQAGPEYGLR